MLGRLLTGLLKGLILGALVGYGLCALGFAVPPALVAYPAAALMGALLACLAGKPIWSRGARIEVGMKATVAAILMPLLLLAARRWVTVPLPFDLPKLVGLDAPSATLGDFAMTSYAMIAAVLAGFFDADNDPKPASEESDKSSRAAGKRIEVSAEEPGARADVENEEAAARRQGRS